MSQLNQNMNEFPLLSESEGIPLFYPHVSKAAIEGVVDTLSSRWIGQGPKVELFEKLVSDKITNGSMTGLAVGSGTDALHLAYLLAGVQAGDEVIVPVFTCTATNIPLLYIGAKPVFADLVPQTLNINVQHVKELITPKTKAVVCVDYGGYPCDYSELRALCDLHKIPLISDAAHSIGTVYQDKSASEWSDFAIFSFQAIKTITTGDGGMLMIKDSSLIPLAKRLRWFGINREAKQGGIWENDILEVGYKYQMTDIAAAMGIAAIEEFDNTKKIRQQLFNAYLTGLSVSNHVTLVGKADADFCPWLITILTPKRVELMMHLRKNGIESAQVHYRNDRYSIFGGRVNNCPNMDEIEDSYLVLPLHLKMTISDVYRVCDCINKFH